MANKNGTIKRTRPSRDSLEAQVQVLSALTSRLKLASGLGLSHGGDRDIYETLGYPKNISSSDLITQWKRQDIARAIIDRPTKATWKGDVYVSEPNIEDESELEQAYRQLDERLGLKAKLMRLDRLSQLGRYAVMLLGFDDSSKETWSQPVGEGERKLMYTRVVSEKNAEIKKYETDPNNERFGLPRIYQITLKKPGVDDTTVDSIELNVHYTRVLHVSSDLLEDEVNGEPILKTAFNRLKDIEKLVGGSAEMFWRGARPGYAGKAQEDYKIGDDAKKDMQEQIEEYENDLRRILVTEGIDLESLAQQVSDPEGHVKVQMTMISALTGIPLRILMGSERGELASTQDEGNWKEWLQTRREEDAEPNILRPFVNRMLRYEVLPEPEDTEQGYSVIWPDLFTIGEKEKGEIASNFANALQAYAKQPMAEQMVPLQAFLQYFLKMDKDTVEQIIEIRDAEMEDMIREEDELEDSALGVETETESEQETE